MPLLGQASGAWTESSSALRLLNAGIRNSIGVLTDDAFTQANPPISAVAGTISAQVDTTLVGVLSGSVAFTRPDAADSNSIGGPLAAGQAVGVQIGYYPVGLFINSAAGNAFENTPGTASGKGPYMSAQGTYGNGLFETNLLGNTADAVNAAQGDAITYITGMELIASLNGYLTPRHVVDGTGIDIETCDVAAIASEPAVRTDGVLSQVSTLLGVLKMAPDATQNELVYDQRV